MFQNNYDRTLPLRLLLPKVDTIYKAVCIHCHFGSFSAQCGLLSIQVIAAILYTAGIHTRIMSIVSWYLYFSLSLRNTWLNFILDRYIHYLLFYSMLLPLDGCWCVPKTITSLTKRPDRHGQLVLSPATVRVCVCGNKKHLCFDCDRESQIQMSFVPQNLVLLLRRLHANF